MARRSFIVLLERLIFIYEMLYCSILDKCTDLLVYIVFFLSKKKFIWNWFKTFKMLNSCEFCCFL
jgi:hypothetical protein